MVNSDFPSDERYGASSPGGHALKPSNSSNGQDGRISAFHKPRSHKRIKAMLHGRRMSSMKPIFRRRVWLIKFFFSRR